MGAFSQRICAQLASMSSATSIISAVCTPCPMSDLPITTVMVLSRPTFTQPLRATWSGLGANRDLRNCWRAGLAQPTKKLLPTMAAMKVRRCMCVLVKGSLYQKAAAPRLFQIKVNLMQKG